MMKTQGSYIPGGKQTDALNSSKHTLVRQIAPSIVSPKVAKSTAVKYSGTTRNAYGQSLFTPVKTAGKSHLTTKGSKFS